MPVNTISKNSSNEQVLNEVVIETQELSLIEKAENIEGELYYIKNIFSKNGQTSIEIDKIEWLSSADNTCSTTPEVKLGMPQCNPNGFLIQNSSSDLKIFGVLSSISIQTTAFGANPSASTKTSLQEFGQAFTSQNEYFKFTPFIIQIKDDSIIVAIQKKYIP